MNQSVYETDHDTLVKSKNRKEKNHVYEFYSIACGMGKPKKLKS